MIVPFANAKEVSASCVWGEPKTNIVNPFACYIQKAFSLGPDDTLRIVSELSSKEITAVHFWLSPSSHHPWNIRHIPREIFMQFENLKSFSLPGNVELLSANDLAAAKNLEALTLSNSIKVIEKRTFSSATKLIKIDLSTNKIGRIAPNAFDGLVSLKTLHLDRNRLSHIDRTMFASIESLSTLTLSFNKIERIDAAALNLPNLIEIDLSHNKLRTLSDTTFDQSPKLQKIQLKSNKLQTIGRTFDRLMHLQSLNLDRNQIEDIRLSAFARLPRLDCLSLQYNGHPFDALVSNASIDVGDVDDHRSMVSVRELLLAGNNLTNRHIFNILRQFGFTQLEKIDLDANEFDEIDFNEIEQFPRLKQINLGKNNWSCEWLNQTVQRLEDENIGINLYSSHFPMTDNWKHINFIQCI